MMGHAIHCIPDGVPQSDFLVAEIGVHGAWQHAGPDSPLRCLTRARARCWRLMSLLWDSP
jgi:hypothetical protein